MRARSVLHKTVDTENQIVTPVINSGSGHTTNLLGSIQRHTLHVTLCKNNRAQVLDTLDSANLLGSLPTSLEHAFCLWMDCWAGIKTSTEYAVARFVVARWA
jgi:hypothetical protein